MKTPLSKLKERFYRGKTKKYFQAGRDYQDYSKEKLNKIKNNLSPSTKQYFEQTISTPKILAYHEVQGQLTLIDADIFGLIPSNYTEYDLNCAFDVGHFFYNIKLIDSFLDNKTNMPLEERAEYLDEAEKTFLNQKFNSTHNGEFNNILEIISSYPIYNSQELKRLYKKLKPNIIKSLSEIPNSQRLKSTLEIGADMGEAMFVLMDGAYQMPEWSYGFLIQQGASANIFDDIKDFNIDRKKNQGYSLPFFPALLGSFLTNYYDLHRTFPSKNELKSFYSFMFLGGIFQLEELLKIRPRS